MPHILHYAVWRGSEAAMDGLCRNQLYPSCNIRVAGTLEATSFLLVFLCPSRLTPCLSHGGIPTFVENVRLTIILFRNLAKFLSGIVVSRRRTASAITEPGSRKALDGKLPWRNIAV